VRLSLLVAGAGLTVCCLGTHVPRIVSTFSRLAFQRDTVPGTATWTTPLLAIGIAVFFLGIGYPGARTEVVRGCGSVIASAIGSFGPFGRPCTTPFPTSRSCHRRNRLAMRYACAA
jgi:hypothetical protein